MSAANARLLHVARANLVEVSFELQRIPECAANDEDLWSILLVCSCLPTHVDFIYTVLYF